jgi:hypothetical protein
LFSRRFGIKMGAVRSRLAQFRKNGRSTDGIKINSTFNSSNKADPAHAHAHAGGGGGGGGGSTIVGTDGDGVGAAVHTVHNVVIGAPLAVSNKHVQDNEELINEDEKGKLEGVEEGGEGVSEKSMQMEVEVESPYVESNESLVQREESMFVQEKQQQKQELQQELQQKKLQQEPVLGVVPVSHVGHPLTSCGGGNKLLSDDKTSKVIAISTVPSCSFPSSDSQTREVAGINANTALDGVDAAAADDDDDDATEVKDTVVRTVTDIADSAAAADADPVPAVAASTNVNITAEAVKVVKLVPPPEVKDSTVVAVTTAYSEAEVKAKAELQEKKPRVRVRQKKEVLAAVDFDIEFCDPPMKVKDLAEK